MKLHMKKLQRRWNPLETKVKENGLGYAGALTFTTYTNRKKEIIMNYFGLHWNWCKNPLKETLHIIRRSPKAPTYQNSIEMALCYLIRAYATFIEMVMLIVHWAYTDVPNRPQVQYCHLARQFPLKRHNRDLSKDTLTGSTLSLHSTPLLSSLSSSA